MGIFVFEIGHFLSELKAHAPLFAKWFALPYEKALQAFSSLPPLSIDHMLLEKTASISLIPYPSFWSDLGAWERLATVLPKDRDGNFSSHGCHLLDTKESLIFGEGIHTLGVEGLLIVRIGGSVVVCQRSEMGRLSELQAQLDAARQKDSC